MTYEEFINLNDKFRMSAEWDNKLEECNNSSAFIIGDNYKTQIWWYDKEHFKVLYYGAEKYKQKLNKLNIPYIWTSDRMKQGGGVEHEYKIEFKYFDDCIEIFKPKKAPARKINPFSVKNQNIFLRFMRNIDYEYYDNLLNKNIQGKRVSK